jgi:hypothetical protein
MGRNGRRWTARGLTTAGAATAALLSTIGSAVAITAALDDAPPAVAPVAGATHWVDGPAQDVTDPEVGRFSFEAGFVNAGRRAAERLGQVDPSEAGFRALAQDAYDSLLHMKPDTPLTHSMDVGHPDYTPDWDGDGAYGEPEDYDRDVDAVPDVARFRYPCNGLDGVVTFERTDGTCGTDGPLRTGVVREVRIVNARGFILDATVWLPAGHASRAAAGRGRPRRLRPPRQRPGRCPLGRVP